MTGVTRPYRGVSAQDRRAGRRARLIEAALDVLGEGGLANMTMTAVCNRAGLTERYFYESFKDRDELLIALFDTSIAEMDEKMFHALAKAQPDLLDRCRAAAAAIVAVLTDDPRRTRLYIEASGSQVLRARRTAAVKTHASVLAEQIRVLRGIEGPELELATLIIIAGVAEAIADWLEGGISLPRDTLIEECARLAVAAADAAQATRR